MQTVIHICHDQWWCRWSLKKRFDLLENRYQNNLQSMGCSEFVFNCVQLLHYECHKINLNRGGSYIDPPDPIKTKKQQ